MAGYSGTPLAKKLGIKPESLVALLGAPSDFERQLTGLPDRVRFTTRAAGAPELVAEIAASSAAIDLHAKLAAYLRNGVREYIVWRVFDRGIDWFVSRKGRFDRLVPKEGGRLESEMLPGLWLDPVALIGGDMPSVARTVQQGLATPEHAVFVDRLRQQAASI